MPTPTPAFPSWRISGEVLWVGPSCLMHYPVPYIPTPHVPAGGLEKGGTVLAGPRRLTHNLCQVCMMLYWETNPPVRTVLCRMSRTAASTQAPFWNGLARTRSGALGNPTKLREFLISQGHLSPPEVHLLMHTWIHFGLRPVSLCRTERIKLMELNSLRDPKQKRQTGCEVPRVTRKSCLILLGLSFLPSSFILIT